MLSLSKIALFSLISFATLALAVPALEPRSVNTRALFAGANVQIVNTMCPVGSSTFLSFSSTHTVVTSIINEFIIALKESNLDCSVQEILEPVANLITTILDPLSTAYGLNSDLLRPIGGLVVAIADLVQVVLGLVGPFATKLLALLIGNGCAGIIAKLGLRDLINSLGIAQTVGHLLIGLRSVL